jgi:hypothetical protein
MSSSSSRGGRSAAKLGGRQTTIIDIVLASYTLSRRPRNPALGSSATPTAMSAASPCVRLDGRSDSVVVRPRWARLIVRAGSNGGMVVIVAAVP